MATGEVLLDHYMAMNTGIEDESIIGIETVEPAFGLNALWINDEMRDRQNYRLYRCRSTYRYLNSFNRGFKEPCP